VRRSDDTPAARALPVIISARLPHKEGTAIDAWRADVQPAGVANLGSPGYANVSNVELCAQESKSGRRGRGDRTKRTASSVTVADRAVRSDERRLPRGSLLGRAHAGAPHQQGTDCAAAFHGVVLLPNAE
jgi:hypothetical protein